MSEEDEIYRSDTPVAPANPAAAAGNAIPAAMPEVDAPVADDASNKPPSDSPECEETVQFFFPVQVQVTLDMTVDEQAIADLVLLKLANSLKAT